MNSELSPKALEILACARSLLAARGYNGFSYADVSAAVNISKPSVHHHFASKTELVREVLVRYRAEIREGVTALERQVSDPVTQLQAYTDYWSACIREGTLPFCVCAMLAAELPAIPAEVAEEVRGHFSELSAWLTAVFTRGAAQKQLFLQATPEEEARTFMATVHGAMLSARAFGDAEIFPRTVQPLLQRLTSS
jgi:TetR/AcrR family transcriptional repressor of nem operon